MTTGQTVNHWQQGTGVVEKVLEDGFGVIRFKTGIRILSPESLKDENGVPLVPKPEPPAEVKSPHKRRTFDPLAKIRVRDIHEPLLEFLAKAGVSIRIMAAPEHVAELNYLLHHVGASIPEDFEPVAVGENGGETRPWAPGFVCTFPKPPESVTTLKFRDEGNGMVSTASTSFALGIIQSGFPITTWKGRKDVELRSEQGGGIPLGS